MKIIIGYILVFLLAATPFFEVVSVIPLGALSGLQTWAVVLIGFIGNLLTVLLVIALIGKIQTWRANRRNKNANKENRRSERAKRIWVKYGLPGLAFLGPVLVGSHLAAFLSMTFGGSKKSVSIWVTASLVFWAVLTGILTHLGVDILFRRSDWEGFFTE